MRKLTPETRMRLSEPLGKLIGEDEAIAAAKAAGGMVISVGDRCSFTLLSNGLKPDVVIYDYMCMRAEIDLETREMLDRYDGEAVVVKNPAGTITDELRNVVERVVKKGNGKIRVDGEEDLAALVAIMAAKDGAVVLYGQPHAGIVLVKVDEKKRAEMRAIYAKMDVIS